MNNKLRKIINKYGVKKQLKYFQSEVFELNEAILDKENFNPLDNAIETLNNMFRNKKTDSKKEHITEELADVMVILKQFQLYYDISSEDIKKEMTRKVDRQLERINTQNKIIKINETGIIMESDGITIFELKEDNQ